MSKKCFIVSPIGNAGSKIRKHADNVYNHLIKPVCEINDIECTRVDEFATTTSITDDIFNCLDMYDLAIVDITSLNPNVFLELGYRIAKGKCFILIKDSNYDEPFPFDIQNIRICEYSLELDDIDDSKNTLSTFIENVDYNQNNVVIKHKNKNGDTFEIIHDEHGVTFY